MKLQVLVLILFFSCIGRSGGGEKSLNSKFMMQILSSLVERLFLISFSRK